MLIPIPDFGPNPGALDAYEYVPAELLSGAPLVVVLHGCTQTASSMENAGWNALADAGKFAVLYPQQRGANNPLQCFNWFTPGDIARGSGEAMSIANMIDHELTAHGSDLARVYITGVSAGGAFSAVMAAAYPDKIAAASIMAGIAYGCGSDAQSAMACMTGASSANKSPMQWGDLVRAAHAGYTGAYPRIQIWQGTADTAVAPSNATELVEQWTNVWNTDATADATDTFGRATHTSYNAGTATAVELYSIANMSHGIAIGDDSSGTCPARVGPYFVDVGVCSTLHAAAFFGVTTGSGSGSGAGSGGGGSDSDASSGCSTTRSEPSWLVLAAGAVVLAARGRRGRARRSSDRHPGSNRRRR